jgi:hypothetical protein
LRGQAASIRKPNTLNVIERKPFRMIIMEAIHILMYIFEYLEFIMLLIGQGTSIQTLNTLHLVNNPNYTIFKHKL